MSPTVDSMQRVIHELHVNQIELEMQNQELRRVQAELDVSHANYVDLYEQAPVGYCSVDASGVVVRANLTAAGVLGVARTDIIGRRLTHFVAREDQDILYLSLKRLTDLGTPQSCDLRMTKGDGSILLVHLAARAAPQDGAAPLLRVTLSDITEQIRLTEELGRHRTHLRQTQSELRSEQQQRFQIEEQVTTLQALLQERTEMLDVLAHEVRQPLNNASAALQSAQRAFAGPDDRHAAHEVVRAQAVLSRVLSSIDNTLAVASLLARPDPIQRADTDIDTLIAVAIADMPSTDRARIQVQRDTATRTALMDMSLLRLALRNLLSNALKFSPPGAAVQVRIADSDTPLALLIDVSDRGSGIAASVLPRLFTRGARGGDAHAGHGVGLYIVQQVMALHGGSVEVVSTGPEGSTLRVI